MLGGHRLQHLLLSHVRLASLGKLECRKFSSEISRFEELKAKWWSYWEESSGQRELDALKKTVHEKSISFDRAVQRVVECRDAVEAAQKAHDDSHKRHASLLMRREQWDKADATSFVDVTASEVQSRQALYDTRDALRRAEDKAGQCQRDYMDAMRQRYHEEQMWQDKWRMISTYGTWSLIGLNTVIFLFSQFFYQWRESQRLKAMGRLINENLLSLQETLASHLENQLVDDQHAKSGTKQTPGSDTLNQDEKIEQLPEKLKTSDEEKKAEKENIQQKVPSHEPVDWMKAAKEMDYGKVKQFVNDLQIDVKLKQVVKDIHGPSVALGAVTGASIILILSLVSSKR
jgi:hypothetical protein